MLCTYVKVFFFGQALLHDLRVLSDRSLPRGNDFKF